MKKLNAIPAGLILLSACLAGAAVVGPEPQGVDDRFVPEPDGVQVESWVEGLVAPWSLVFLGGGRALVSERPGRIRLIQDGDLVPRPWLQVEAAAVGEGGLMGLALHPDFPDQPFLYAMHTYREGMSLYNRVVRIRDRGEQGELDRVIIDRIPGGRYHDGGRIGFGPDGMLYVTAGETFERSLAQDLDSLGGKILRATPEGSVPEDNPFEGSLIYSYGHRNPQGIDWHPTTGRLYASEHGPSGEEGHQGHDEINIVLKGENYGWPEVIGAPGNPDFVDPIVVWKRATPPAGIQFCSGELFEMLEGDLMVATLRSEALIRINLEPETGGPAQARVAGIERWFASGPHSGTYGRLRDVVQGPDGALYVLTSNRDGRGSPRPGDDRILRITPLGP